MVDEEISEEGRQARFARWEKLDLDAVKQDLATGGHRLIGGPPAVRRLAMEWVQMKEAAKLVEDAERTAQAFRRALEMETEAKTPSQEEHADPPREEKPVELMTLKPGIWGMSIDLKEAGRRLRRRLKKS